ncbi:MAG: diguanylate cyclase [Chloroflexota bacterium]
MKWDIFISHAFEDKEFARSLADALAGKGLSIWFDEFELKVGDSLRRSIDFGLSKSRYGVVILSPNFFAKEWTQKELDALTARETKDKKIILPIWHNISAKEIRKYSPMLADRLAIDSVVGIETVVDKLLSKIKRATSKSKNANIIDVESLLQISSALQKTKQKLETKENEIQTILAQAHEISHTDALTFLPNRRQVMVDLINAVTFSDSNNTSLTISMLDIDNFKHINDTYGQIIGDDVLRNLATEFRRIIRRPNIVGRYSGEAFLIIFPQTTLDKASKQVESFYRQIRSVPITSGEYEFDMTVSMGIVQYKIGEEDWQKLLARADRALHQAKDNGRDQWVRLDD